MAQRTPAKQVPEHQSAPARPDRHSRLVGWLKVALPLSALAILSSLFLVARTIDPEGALTLSEAELADRLREPRVSAPTFAGVTRDGATLSITAREARPEAGGDGLARDVRAQLVMTDGARLALSSGTVRYLRSGGAADFSGGVLLAHSLGYEFRTDSLSLSLDRTGAQSGGPVEGYGPPGQITAGRMEISPDPGGGDVPGRYLLVFNEGVRLIYRPGVPPAPPLIPPPNP